MSNCVGIWWLLTDEEFIYPDSDGEWIHFCRFMLQYFVQLHQEKTKEGPSRLTGQLHHHKTSHCFLDRQSGVQVLHCCTICNWPLKQTHRPTTRRRYLCYAKIMQNRFCINLLIIFWLYTFICGYSSVFANKTYSTNNIRLFVVGWFSVYRDE